jgi:hypothetical protein
VRDKDGVRRANADDRFPAAFFALRVPRQRANCGRVGGSGFSACGSKEALRAILFGTTEQLAEKVDFSKRTKNGTRQDAPGTIREDWLMVLHPPNFALLLSISTFSASCEVVP